MFVFCRIWIFLRNLGFKYKQNGLHGSCYTFSGRKFLEAKDVVEWLDGEEEEGRKVRSEFLKTVWEGMKHPETTRYNVQSERKRRSERMEYYSESEEEEEEDGADVYFNGKKKVKGVKTDNRRGESK